jgi:hypothetical protein
MGLAIGGGAAETKVTGIILWAQKTDFRSDETGEVVQGVGIKYVLGPVTSPNQKGVTVYDAWLPLDQWALIAPEPAFYELTQVLTSKTDQRTKKVTSSLKVTSVKFLALADLVERAEKREPVAAGR